jgi:CRISPR-associated endoribonuclease Cas6
MNLKLRDGGILITSTPVVVRIPRVRYCDYGIESSHEYVYWRMQYPVNAFLKQLEENLQRKYTEFHGEDITVPLVFEEMQSIKNPAVYTTIDNNRVQIVGSTWKFHLSRMTPDQRKLLEFGVDCGFGELNTFGFGFMNQLK